MWEKVSDNPANCGNITSTSGFSNEISYSGNPCSTTLRITATNNCGSKTITTTIVGSYNPGGPLRQTSNQNVYKVYPNPSNTVVNISLGDANSKLSTKSQINAQLFNMMGEMKSNVIITNNIATINVAGLPRGIYVLKINIDGTIESHQIAVE